MQQQGFQEVEIGSTKKFVLSESLESSKIQPIFSDAWTGSRVWTASIELATLLQSISESSTTNRNHWWANVQYVVELGSGCGLGGLVAATFPQMNSVLMTDQSDIVPLLQQNIKLNRALFSPSTSIKATEYTWGNDAKELGAPDLVLVSDCINPIYGCDSWRQLAASIIKLLRRNSSANARAIVSYEHRGRDEAWEDFTNCIKNQLSYFCVKTSDDNRISLFILQKC